MNRKFRTVILAGGLALGTAVPLVSSGTEVSAQSNCSAGVWGGNNAWGDCRGTGKWRLKVSCTWGQSKTSPILTGPGHVDVTCPYGTRANAASIIYL